MNSQRNSGHAQLFCGIERAIVLYILHMCYIYRMLNIPSTYLSIYIQPNRAHRIWVGVAYTAVQMAYNGAIGKHCGAKLSALFYAVWYSIF